MPKSPSNESVGLPSEELKQSTTLTANEINDTGIVKTHGESTTLTQTSNDLQGRHESDNSSLPSDSQQFDSKHVHENHVTDSNDKSQTCSGEGELKSEKTVSEETTLKVDRNDELEPHLSDEKKTDFSKSKTDASQIIADVVESIEQESTPPVAPPRRRKKKKKAESELQVSNTLTGPFNYYAPVNVTPPPPLTPGIRQGLGISCFQWDLMPHYVGTFQTL